MVGAFLSRHEQLTLISVCVCETRGGDGARGLFVMRLPTAAMVTVTAATVTEATMTTTATVAVATATAVEKTTIN